MARKRVRKRRRVPRKPEVQEVKVRKRKPAPGRRVHKKRRKPPRNYKVPTFITFFLLTIYLLGYLFAFTQKPSIGVETVGYGTIDAPKTLRGIIVRDEAVAVSPMDGQAVYHYSEGERVKKGVAVCSIKNVANTDIIEPKLDDLKKDIAKLQKSRSDISIFQEDIRNIEKNISDAVGSYIYKFVNGNISEMYGLKNQVDTQIKRRNDIWILENTQNLSELSEERAQYESQLAENMSQVSAAESGMLTFYLDGMEDKLTEDSLNSITEEQTKMKLVPELLTRSDTIKKDEPVFKIVKSNVWYIASYVPAEMAAEWAQGDSKTLYTSVNEEDKMVEVTVDRIATGEKISYVVFRTDKSVADFISVRNLEFTIKDAVYNGIKIPNTAIVEKTLLKVPLSCKIENAGETGVIKKIEGVGSFTKVPISRMDEDDGNPETEEYMYISQDYEVLKVGDIIMRGEEEYTVSEVTTYQGVYVANSSIAEFTPVTIIAQNNEYSIVEVSGGNYGLKVYDTIVSDSKSIQDSDTIY